jgi:FixJ family two-component response regulator
MNRFQMSAPRPIVCVVDDDDSSRESLDSLLRSAGFEAHAFASAASFLDWDSRKQTGCLISDLVMTPMNGAEMQQALTARGRDYPIIFVTAFADPELQERLLAQGAVRVLPKPFDAEVLLELVGRSIRERPAP